MAGPEQEEDDFFDDDLDDIPLEDLAELENNAVQFTQTATQPRLQPAAPSSDYGDDFDDEDLDDAVIIDESRSTPVNMPANSRGNTSQVAKREPLRQQPYGNNGGIVNRLRPNVPPFHPSEGVPILPPSSSWVSVKPGSQSEGTNEAKALRQQLEELRRHNQTLEQNLNEKAGEVSIVRSKQEKEAKEHERELNALQKLSEEKLAKQRKELEAARIAANNAATERDFVKQDLAESERVRRLNRAIEKKDSVVTPKKKKALPHRDGFDDDEIEMLSPSKISPSKFRGRIGTPTKPGKRKRKVVESPAPALNVIQVDEPLTVEEEHKFPQIFDDNIIASLGIQDDRFDFLGTILDHRPNKDKPRTIVELENHHLPSKPDESFQSMILGKIPTLGLKKPISELPWEFCEYLISLWSKCMDESHYEPLYLLIDLLMLALELKTLTIAPLLVDTLLPIAHQTAGLVLIKRYRGTPLDKKEELIDVGSCLQLLHLTALGCMSEREHITRFWRLMITQTVCMTLSYKQPLTDTELMLKLLSTSILPTSFGMVIPNSDAQTKASHANYILDYLSDILHGTRYKPSHPDDDPNKPLIPVETHHMQRLRLSILHLMMSMTRSPFASAALVAHKFAIPRLICLMSDELDVLYDHSPGHASSALLVTLATRLLYHLTTAHDSALNLQSKLGAVHGASQKYLLVLARLNFSEDELVLEAGVEGDVPGLALEMLEGAVTPDEGDQILGAFLQG